MLGLVCILGIMHYVKQLSFIQSSQNLALLPQIFPVENNVKMSFVFSQFLETGISGTYVKCLSIFCKIIIVCCEQ